jgi:hypothetical protein
MKEPLKAWHQVMENGDTSGLEALLADDAVMISPVVHTPQRGKDITFKYLSSAADVFNPDKFVYVRQLQDENGAILEFETEVDGISVNGVDMIKWNEDGLITEFKVMLRPLKAVNIIHQKMGEMLLKMTA